MLKLFTQYSINLRYPKIAKNWEKQDFFAVSVLERFGILELPNRVTQNDVTLRVTNSEIFIEILFPSYWLDFTKHEIKLGVTNSKLKNVKLHFELLTRSWKMFDFNSSYLVHGKTFIFSILSY